MSALITGDIHWSANPRNAYRFKFVDWLCKAIIKYEVKDLIILGDITDIKDEHSAEFVNEVVKHLVRLAELCSVVIITGNHDYVNNVCPFFQFVEHIKNIWWDNEIQDGIRLESIGENCLILPHTKDWKKEWKPYLEHEHDCVFTHCTFEGATGESGHKLSGIDSKLFKKQGLVVSGDIHTPQHFDNIIYAGAPYTINFGDSYQGRVVLFPGGDAWKSIKVDIPQKRLLPIDSMDALTGFAYDLHPGDIVKIEYNLKRKDQKRWYDIKSEVQAWGQKEGLVVDAVVPVIDIQTTYKKIDLETDAELIKAYAKSIKASVKTLERGLYLADRAAT